MLDYLKNYGITDEQIPKIVDAINNENVNIDIFKYDSEKVTEILDLFKNMGINNYYEIIVANPTMFCDTIKSIRTRLDSYDNKQELAELINSNVNNLSIVDLL